MVNDGARNPFPCIQPLYNSSSLSQLIFMYCYCYCCCNITHSVCVPSHNAQEDLVDGFCESEDDTIPTAAFSHCTGAERRQQQQV